MPNVSWGQYKGAYCSEDIRHQTFGAGEFDLVVIQDVFEHVMHPELGFAVPWHGWQPTRVRTVEEAGVIKYVLSPEYHGNPIDDSGSLVITEWGAYA